MGNQKTRKRRKGKASQTAITNSGLHIFQKGDQIKSLGWNRWDVASQSAEDMWYRVSFADKSPTCVYTPREKGAGAST